MNRRVTFNIDDEETVNNALPPPAVTAPTRSETAPPNYIKFSPGGKLEFLKDLEAYQAACLLNKVYDGALEQPLPAYTLQDYGPQGVDGAKQAFRERFEKQLTELKKYLQERPRGRITKNSLSEKAKILSCLIALITLTGLAIAWIFVIHHVGILAVVGIVWVTFLLGLLINIRRYYSKRKFIKVINHALLSIDCYEKLDDKTVKDIKKGIENAVPGRYWAENAVRLKANRPNRPTSNDATQ